MPIKEVLLQDKEIEPCIKLWASVLKRAYLDATGKVTDIRYYNDPIKMRKNIQKEALRFLKTNPWIYSVTGVDYGWMQKLIRANYKEIGNGRKTAKNKKITRSNQRYQKHIVSRQLRRG